MKKSSAGASPFGWVDEGLSRQFVLEIIGIEYPEEKPIKPAKEVKSVVDDKAKYTDRSQRADIKAGLIMLLAENGKR